MLLDKHPRTLVVDAIHETLDEARLAPEAMDSGALLDDIAERVDLASLPSLRPVFNATGIVLHTNLGRAPLAPAVIAAVTEISGGYTNLEYDLDEGRRGS